MKIKWVPLALDDLKDIYDHIARENDSAANKVLSGIWEATNLLTDHANIGRPGRVPDTRELFVMGTPFNVPYRVVSGKVQILRIFNNKRN